MEQQNSVGFVTLFLAAVAGYCDTLTFVSADAVFSAHVTGNFIVFAYQATKGFDANSWIKLLTFPVFILSVITGGLIAGKTANKHILLLLEGLLLLLCGCIVLYSGISGSITITYTIVMIIVFAMGLQNAFGKLFGKETYGPTTMMTGNVTQASLDFGSLLKSGFKDADVMAGLKKQLYAITGFLGGCFTGALAANNFGLQAIILPGIGMLICYFLTRRNSSESK